MFDLLSLYHSISHDMRGHEVEIAGRILDPKHPDGPILIGSPPSDDVK